MKIQYLGTAAAEGYPSLFCNCKYCNEARKLGGKNFRTRSQCLIDQSLLIDFPAESYSHITRYDIPLSHIHSILITHTHQDHLYLEDLGMRCEQFGFAHNIDGMLTLYGNDTLYKKYTQLYANDKNDTHLTPYLACQQLTEYETVEIEGYKITALLANHDKNEKCFIYYIEKDHTALLYGNDTGWFPDSTWKFLAGKPLNLISLDCTFMQYHEGSNHMGIPDNIEVCENLKKIHCFLPKSKVILTHFSHNGHMLHNDIEQLANKYNFTAAYDGMEITF